MRKMGYKINGLLFLLLVVSFSCRAWGFFGHKKINHLAVFSLPPQMLVWYKPHIHYITDHAPDPDKRRYAVKGEGAHHFIDIDYYGNFPYPNLPRRWESAVAKYSEDTLQEYGTVPWHALRVFYRLKRAFEQSDEKGILRYSTFLGHYIADACVPLHASSNYNGQKTGQKGIHALWESEIPELFADTSFRFWTGKAEYVEHPNELIWEIVLESAQAADTVLRVEKRLLENYNKGEIHAFKKRKGIVTRRYSVGFAHSYNKELNGMVNRRMNRAIHAIASLWYTAWIDAGQPDLKKFQKNGKNEIEQKAFKMLDKDWHHANFKTMREH